MNLKSLALWLLLTGIIALGTLWLAASLAPTVIMHSALERLTQRYGAVTNMISHSAPVVAHERRVVRPSPDLAYSICVFDLSELEQLSISMPKSKDYLSVALYDHKTNNFFHLNDAQLSTDQATIRLYGPRVTIPKDVNQTVDDYALNAPTQRGLVLFRAVVRSANDWQRINTEREQLRCVAHSSLG